MPSTFYGLNIATTGMSTYNAVLNTTGHNVSNVKTPGYSKQSVIQKAQVPVSLRTSYGMIGAGVEAVEIASSRDEYYDFKYRKTNATYGYYTTSSYYMKSIEDYLYVKDEKSGGLSKSLNDFFSGLSHLTTGPNDTTIRAEVTGYGETMAKYANEMAVNLQQMQSDLNRQIASTVGEINSYAKELASLTKQINALEVYGNRANDLRDQRALILDELSLLADINVVEKEPADGNGVTQYIVSLGGGVLVDTYHAYSIEVSSKQTYDNQSDATGLYELKWSNGQDFAVRSTKLGGELQALFELRDGNNGENFVAGFKGYEVENDSYDKASTITLTSDELSSANASNLAQLSIPETKGILDIGRFTFEYESFDVAVAADGTYTYTFVLKENLTVADTKNLDIAKNAKNPQASIGDAVAFRGVPYYQSQINEFLRTFSANFNELQNAGYDLYNNHGVDFFVATDVTSGDELEMKEFLKHTDDGFYYLNGCKVITADLYDSYTAKYGVEAVTGEPGYYNLLDEDANIVEKIYVQEDKDDPIFTFSSTAQSGDIVSYYSISALHFAAKATVVKDGKLLACAKGNIESETGIDEGKNLDLMSALQNSNKMFKQGAPLGFLQVMTATVGVDSKKIALAEENSKNIVDAVDNRRLSTAGVDEDEEGQNLIITQNLLNIQYRVISVMNEVLDRLINSTGV